MRNSTCTFEHLSSTSHALINSSTNKSNRGMHLHASNYHNLSQMSGYFSPRGTFSVGTASQLLVGRTWPHPGRSCRRPGWGHAQLASYGG